MSSKSIIPAKNALKAFRDSGYKGTASAIAEIIDNSIEADSKNIDIIAFEEIASFGKQINKLIIYDDGHGMDPNILSACLQWGEGTRIPNENAPIPKGMGKFGVGLPQASISQCRRVEVYSWKNNECYYNYLDYDEVQESNNDERNEAEKKEIPSDIKKAIEKNNPITDSGTIVVWSKCDRLDISKADTLYRRMKDTVCRIFRHYLDDNDDYGKRVFINFVIQENNEVTKLYSNDPLYTMKPSSTPGFDNEEIFMKTLDKTIDAPYINPFTNEVKKSQVRFIFTAIKPEIWELTNSKAKREERAIPYREFMDHLRDNTGISFIRHAREIDFGSMRYFNALDERQRFWGCEIRFEPEMDAIFGVPNNKQSVRGMTRLDNNQQKDFDKTLFSIDKINTNNDCKLFLRNQLSKIFYHEHKKQFTDVITKRGAGSRSSQKKSNTIVDNVLINNPIKTKSSIEGENKSKDQKTDEWKNIIKTTEPEIPSNKLLEEIAENIKLKVAISFGEWPGNQFFTIERPGDTAVAKINRKHPFYIELYDKLMQEKDIDNIESIDLMIMSFVRMEDELFNIVDENTMDKIRERWGEHLKDFLIEKNKT